MKTPERFENKFYNTRFFKFSNSSHEETNLMYVQIDDRDVHAEPLLHNLSCVQSMQIR